MKRFAGWTVFLLTVAMILAGAVHAQELRDWWFLQTYEPTDEIADLADRSAMSEEGRDYFYMSDPQINTKSEFNNYCTPIEESLVLGCYRAQRIHILEIERDELDGIMEVTAAHEMLHAVYDRLPERERVEVAELLKDDFERLDDPVIDDLIASYEERGGHEVREDELHSVLPTQVEDLSEELEDYYEQYFDDRTRVAELYNQYESTFRETRERIDRLDNEIQSLRVDIEHYESRIESLQQQINELEDQLDEREAEDDIEGYNQLVPEQNQAVREYNSLIERYRSVINRHNQRVDELNETVLLREELVNSIDSTYEEL